MHFRVVPVIGPLFLLDVIGSLVVAALLLLPTGPRQPLLALGGIAIAVPRPAVVVALALEAVTAVLLAAYLATLARARS